MADLLPEFPSNFAHATYVGVEPGDGGCGRRGEKWREKGDARPCNETWRPFKPEFRFFVLSPGFKRWNELLSLAGIQKGGESPRMCDWLPNSWHENAAGPSSFLPSFFLFLSVWNSRVRFTAGLKSGETERYFSGTSQTRLRPASEFLFSCSLRTDCGRN